MSLPRPRTVEPVAGFASAFDSLRGRLPGSSGRVAEERQAAFERFKALGVPTPRVETWKYTNAAGYANKPFAVAPRPTITPDELIPHFLGGPKARRLIMVNGRIVAQYSHVGGLPDGMTIRSLARTLEETPDAVPFDLGSEAEHSFEALNHALAEDGAVIELADGVTLDEPLQILSILTGGAGAFMVHPRHVVRLGKAARLHLILTTVTAQPGESLLNQVESFDLADDALLQIDRTTVLEQGRTAICRSEFRLGTNTRLEQVSLPIGGTLQRHEIDARLQGTDSHAMLAGLFMPIGTEHVDTMIRVHHEKPNCESDQFYKGIMDQRGHGVFAGKIFVHQPAQKTNAYQKNDNLLLSDDAEIDTKPELEIYADDVKCSHGATVGDLDTQSLFYLRSRGLDLDLARSLLTFAFASEVVERFRDESVMHKARAVITGRLPGGERLAELL